MSKKRARASARRATASRRRKNRMTPGTSTSTEPSCSRGPDAVEPERDEPLPAHADERGDLPDLFGVDHRCFAADTSRDERSEQHADPRYVQNRHALLADALRAAERGDETEKLVL